MLRVLATLFHQLPGKAARAMHRSRLVPCPFANRAGRCERALVLALAWVLPYGLSALDLGGSCL
jgi:hypothetical protein